VEQDTHVFAALFTGVGGHQAAEHCISNCYEVFTKALQQAEPDRALRQTVQQLEASYFALQNLSDQVTPSASL
jgi:serine/threonine protein phosphatase PrpC